MAYVNIEKIIDHLDGEIRNALEDAVREILPNSKLDSYDLYRAFLRAVRRKCRSMEYIPDNYVRLD